jgi:predicted nucleic acid-binding Zn ribbon protein
MVIRRTQSRPLREIIEEVLKSSGIDQQLKERELIRQWDDVVGITISRSTESAYIRDRKLFVKIRSSVIRNELMMIRDGLKTELNRRSGQNLIDEIIIR